MPTVTRLMPFLILLSLPVAAAVEPEEAPALWTESYGGDAVVSVTIEPAAVVEGSDFQGAITFQEDFPVTDVRYQICEISPDSACFASGVPTYRGGSTWSFDTADLESEIGRQAPIFHTGERIGFQLFLCQDAQCDWATETGVWHPFPEGLPEDHSMYDTDFTAWYETHYFATTIQEGTNTTPAPGLLSLLAVLGLAAVIRRWA